MGRSRKHRKRFACGHRGFGQWCHCCVPNGSRRAIADGLVHLSPVVRLPVTRSPNHRTKPAVSEDKQAWKQSFAADPIDLRRLPKPIVLKARGILATLGEGVGYWQLRGRKLRGDRTMVRIPISYRYRLLCRVEGNQLMPLKVLSHEDYNPLVRHKNRV